MDDDCGLADLASEVEDLRSQLDDAREQLAEAMLEANGDGWSLRDIGEVVGMSHTAVRKMILGL